MFDNSQFFSGAKGFYPLTIDQSLRFNDNDSAYLSRTPASAGNRKTMTFSMWVKRGSLATSYFTLFSAGAASPSPRAEFGFNNNAFYVVLNPSGSSSTTATTNAVFRDASAWYHIVVAMDTTQATSTNRLKVWVNSVEQTFSAYAVPTQNTDLPFNNNVAQNIGRYIDGSQFFDGYLAEVHFTDGTAYDANAFGEFKSGVWVAKTPSVTYGTNGFYLDFANSADIGNDVSGEGNDWTPNNFTASDVVLDSPTNNFATLNPLTLTSGASSNGTLSDGNLQWIGTSANDNVFATMAVSSGQWYYELEILANPTTLVAGWSTTDELANYAETALVYFNSAGIRNGTKTVVWGSDVTTGLTFSVNDIIGFALDIDSDELKVYQNNTLVSTITLPTDKGDEWIPAFGDSSSTDASIKVNFGQQDFTYTPPTGYLALSTANLPDPVIDPAQDASPEDYFNTVLYTGNSSTQSITGVGFQPDLLWIKNRTNATSLMMQDSVRGTNADGEFIILSSENTNAEATYSDAWRDLYGAVTSIDSDGFSIKDGTDSTYDVFNGSGENYVAWNWKANGSGVSNTDGSITSTVSANTTSGFSIGTYTGAANSTVGHGLSQTPDFLIVKSRDSTYNWIVHHKDYASGAFQILNGTQAETPSSTYWGTIGPSTFEILTTLALTDPNDSYVFYAFHSVEGFSKFGSYVGNGSTDGPFVYCGFRPAFVMFKRTDNTSWWWMLDTERGTINPIINPLFANRSDAEYSSYGTFDLLSNGFKFRTTEMNTSGGTFIFAAFAENPFKYSLAR